MQVQRLLDIVQVDDSGIWQFFAKKSASSVVTFKIHMAIYVTAHANID